MPLESSKARLKSSQHGYRDLCVTTFLKRSSNNVALASDTFLAFDDQAFNLRQCLAVHLCPQSYVGSGRLASASACSTTPAVWGACAGALASISGWSNTVAEGASLQRSSSFGLPAWPGYQHWRPSEDPVSPVAPIAAHVLRFAVHQFAAACVLDGGYRDQQPGGDHPDLDGHAPELALKLRRSVVPHSLPPRKGAGPPHGQRALRSQQKNGAKKEAAGTPRRLVADTGQREVQWPVRSHSSGCGSAQDENARRRR